MDLTHTFTVPVPAGQAWETLTDLERIAPCMPGATLESVEGETYKGAVKVKVGPMQLTYRGEARFAELDATAQTATIEANGRETRGPGTAKAVVRARLDEQGAGTLVTVSTTLAISGKPAQFGRGVMEEVGNKLLSQFADCLSGELEKTAPAGVVAATPEPSAEEPSAVQPAPAAPIAAAAATDAAGHAAVPAPATPVTAAPQQALPPPAEAVDLLAAASVPVLRRLAPAAALLVLVVVLVRRHRRRRRAGA